MSRQTQSIRVAFIHPDLGIGGAERLVVDAAVGLQKLGNVVDIYTSFHDKNHCFEETRNGTLSVHYLKPPFPRSVMGKFHILFAHLRQLHLTTRLLWFGALQYDVYFVDQLSTCVPFLRWMGHTRVVFYCHFPDKLLANGAFVEGNIVNNQPLLKRIYRFPMDWLEEVTTAQADIILANSNFTARIFATYFPSIAKTLKVVYPGIDISAYEMPVDPSDANVISIRSTRPTLLSLNRFEKKKNVALAIQAFAILKTKVEKHLEFQNMRLVLAGGYDSRLEDNVTTFASLLDLAHSHALSFNIIAHASSPPNIGHFNNSQNPDILFLLNFTTSQRTELLRNPSTKILLYTPANEHFGIVPVEAMGCGVPVLACNSGGPTESVIEEPRNERTGWLRPPDAQIWATALFDILSLTESERRALAARATKRARDTFGMDAMAKGLDKALRDGVIMGRVDSSVATWWFMVMGFLVAYILGPWILPNKPN